MFVLEIAKQILSEGGSVELVVYKGELYFDVKSETKAFLYIREGEDGSVRYVTRYSGDENNIVYPESVEGAIYDLATIIRQECMCGRDFVSEYWLGKFIGYGLAEKVVKTEVVFK